MSEEQKPQDTPEEQGHQDPREYLNRFPEAPTQALIDQWKASACNGRVKVFSPDSTGKRAFVMRGLSAREMEALENEIPKNTPEGKVPALLQTSAVAKACLWTSITTTHKLSAEDLRNAGAGLAPSLYEVVAELSDYLPPQLVQVLSGDL
jgi:hypothetical protein